MPDVDSIDELVVRDPEAEASTSEFATMRFSPFYYSAVNAVAKPDKTVFCSKYFVDRWLPLLGNGLAIVLALRRLGYKDYAAGDHRDEIEIDGDNLAAKCGFSEDTLIRELGIDKKTGKPRNVHLRQFVQKRTVKKRDSVGRIIQERNAYWVAMDDPIHPDDWKQVSEAVRAAEERVEKQKAQEQTAARKAAGGKQKTPDTQNANSAGSPDTQNAGRSPQDAKPDTQNAGHDTQNANHSKSPDSDSPRQTLSDASGAESSLSLFPEADLAPDASDLERAWAFALSQIQGVVSKQSFDSFFRTAKPLMLDEGTAIIAVPSRFAREWLEKNHRDGLASLMGEHLRCEVHVRFCLETEKQS